MKNNILEIRTLNSDAFFSIERFNVKGNLIYYKNSDGYEEWRKNLYYTKNDIEFLFNNLM